MKLYDLLEDKAVTELENIEITSLTDDTRKVQTQRSSRNARKGRGSSSL